MDNWDDLKYILAVYRHGGLSGAARSLGVNHSTVSRRISSIENEMGVQLFNRLPSGLLPTEEGNIAIQSAETIEKKITKLGLEISSRDSELSGELRVTAAQVLIQCHLSEIFTEFARTYPRIKLIIAASNESLNLHQRESDVAIRVSDNPDESLYGRKITEQKRAYYASKTYLQEHGMGLNYIGFTWWGTHPYETVVKKYPGCKIIAWYDDMITLRSAVSSNMGISLMPCIIGSTDKNLVQVPNLSRKKYHDIWVLTHQDLKTNARVKCFMEFVSRTISNKKHLYLGEIN